MSHVVHFVGNIFLCVHIWFGQWMKMSAKDKKKSIKERNEKERKKMPQSQHNQKKRSKNKRNIYIKLNKSVNMLTNRIKKKEVFLLGAR